MKVYIVTYTNHFIEVWEIKEVYATYEDADKEATRLRAKKGNSWDRYTVEEWEVK